MLAIIVVITLLHSHKVVTMELTHPMFGSGRECNEFLEANVKGAQRLANKLYPERTEIELRCRPSKYRWA